MAHKIISNQQIELESVANVTLGNYRAGNYATHAADGELTLHGTARVYRTVTVNFNHTVITGQGKPTLVTRGVNCGFSLPVYNADNEELCTCKSAPLDWDDSADIIMYAGCYIDTANDGKKFKLQLSWDATDLANNAVVGSGSTDVEVETTTGAGAVQYTGYKVAFTVGTVAASVSTGYRLSFRLRRIAASADEIAGEVVVCGMAMKYLVNKLGEAT